MAGHDLIVTAEGRERVILLNARELLSKRASRVTPNWSLAMRIFGLGSTYGWAICETAGIDPDGYTADPRPAPSKPREDDLR